MADHKRFKITTFVLSSQASIVLRVLCVSLLIATALLTIVQSVEICIDFITEKTVSKMFLEESDDGAIINVTMCIRVTHLDDHLETDKENEVDVITNDVVHMGYFEPMLTYTAKSLTWLTRPSNFNQSVNLSIAEFGALERSSHPAFTTNLSKILYNLLVSKLDSNEMIRPSARQNHYDLRMLTRKVTDTRKYNSAYPEFLCISGPMARGLEGFEKLNFRLPLRLLRPPSTCKSHGFSDTFFINHYSPLAMLDLADYLQVYIPNELKHICNASSTIFYITAAFSLRAEKHTQPNLRRAPCVDPNGWIVPAGLGRKICRTECASRETQKRFGCRFALSEPGNDRLHLPYCHWYTMLNILRNDLIEQCVKSPTLERCKSRSLREWSLLIVKLYYDYLYTDIHEKCIAACKTYIFCTEWEISHRQTYEETGSYGNTDHVNQTTEVAEQMAEGSISINKPPFVTVFETSVLLGWADFIANLGGVIGFYFGLSVLSVFEACGIVMLYFSNLKKTQHQGNTLDNVQIEANIIPSN